MNRSTTLTSEIVNSIACVVFDFGKTLSSDFYFNVSPPHHPHWFQTVQERIFKDQALVNRWMRNELQIEDIALIIANEIGMDQEEAIYWSIAGCQEVKINTAVYQFAQLAKKMGRKIVIVTGNMDVFNRYIRPNQGLDELFPVIINSCDYAELDKAKLWPIAFEKSGMGIHYHNCLLIEDSGENVQLFRELGGFAYQYRDDADFQTWVNRCKFESIWLN